MTRRQQYRFLIAGALAVAWITTAVYAALVAMEDGSTVAGQGMLVGFAFLPYTLARVLRLPMQNAMGLVGALLALVLLWIVLTMALWGLLEAAAYLSARLRPDKP